jgi:3-isopropylmalate/(R)-2-methylmalate dehydratase small subunit
MTPFRVHTGRVAAMDRPNVDTDQIIPKQFLKRIERTGFGPALFYDWRYEADGTTPRPDFELNRPPAAGASILLCGPNFGCGSSREHAPWALLDYGFRALLGTTFADIFYNNCFQNGILPLRLEPEAVRDLFGRASAAGASGYELTVDLERCEIRDAAGLVLPFALDPYRRESLLLGLDEIGRTLQHEDAIAAYEASHAGGRPPASQERVG